MAGELLQPILTFLNGAVAMGCGTAGLFFVRFWRRTGDRLFVMFAAAFWILGLIHCALLNQTGEPRLLYSLRLVGYLIILAAIIDKNLRK